DDRAPCVWIRTAVDGQLETRATTEREVTRGGDGFEPPSPSETLGQTAGEGVAFLRCRVFPVIQVDLHGQQIGGLEAKVKTVEHEEAPRHEPGAREQYQGQRHLHDEQPV